MGKRCCGVSTKVQTVVLKTFRAAVPQNGSELIMVGVISDCHIETLRVGKDVHAGSTLRLFESEALALIETGAPLWII